MFSIYVWTEKVMGIWKWFVLSNDTNAGTLVVDTYQEAFNAICRLVDLNVKVTNIRCL